MAGNKWEEIDYWNDERKQKALRKDFTFSDFAEALSFTTKVGALAEEANHHPDINLSWGFVRVWLTTHSEHGITSKDYELSKKIDALF